MSVNRISVRALALAHYHEDQAEIERLNHQKRAHEREVRRTAAQHAADELLRLCGVLAVADVARGYAVADGIAFRIEPRNGNPCFAVVCENCGHEDWIEDDGRLGRLGFALANGFVPRHTCVACEGNVVVATVMEVPCAGSS